MPLNKGILSFPINFICTRQGAQNRCFKPLISSLSFISICTTPWPHYSFNCNPNKIQNCTMAKIQKQTFTTILKDDNSKARLGQVFYNKHKNNLLPLEEIGKGESSTEKEALTNKVKDHINTPMYFIHTLAGSVPHLTAEGLDIIFESKPIPPIQLSVDTMYTLIDCIKPSNLSLAQFVGLSSCETFLTIHNPLADLPYNYNDKTGISIWTRLGRRSLNPGTFRNVLSEFQPTWYQVMSDYDVSKDNSMKRLKKSITRNEDYILHLLENVESQGYVTLEINWFLVDETESKKAINTCLEKRIHISGFVISGFYALLNDLASDDVNDNGNRVNEKRAFDVLATLLSTLPEDIPKFITGPFKLDQIVKLVKLGIDQFDSSIVTKVTELGQAFAFSFGELSGLSSIPHVNEALTVRNGSTDSNSASTNENTCTSKPEDKNGLLINLNETRYFEDFNPIITECSCYTCRKFTRSYIHHLLVTEELLGKVLLMSHNLYHFDKFFKIMQTCLTNNKEVTFLENVVADLPSVPSIDATMNGSIKSLK